MRCLTVAVSSLLLLTAGLPVGAQEAEEGVFELRQTVVSRRQAVVLSALFPGLGQLAGGHRHKGTALMAGEVACLVVWLTSHADYSTQKEQFDLEQERYQSLQSGGSFAAAEESWARLSDKKDDLDGSHTRRRLFGALAAALYCYNVVDVLALDGADAIAERSLRIVPLPGADAPGAALVVWF